jgi:hypothetical protein
MYKPQEEKKEKTDEGRLEAWLKKEYEQVHR